MPDTTLYFAAHVNRSVFSGLMVRIHMPKDGRENGTFTSELVFVVVGW
jgi:hypothetical protein